MGWSCAALYSLDISRYYLQMTQLHVSSAASLFKHHLCQLTLNV